MDDFLDPQRGNLATSALAARLQVSLGEALPLSVARHPDKPCFVFADDSSLSFAEVNARVNKLASALLARGVSKGDRLAVFGLEGSSSRSG
jgi:acyl-CoA synthetase (AMP-forming)/AMP-acid ligase II